MGRGIVRSARRLAAAATGVAAITACAGATPAERPARAPVTAPTTSARNSPTAGPVEVDYRLERRTTDPATAGFKAMVRATLADPRGWRKGDVRLVEDPRAGYLIVLAEPDETQRLCLPYDVYGKYSCQNGPVVALNADRWRAATPKWTGTLTGYRQMLINHEVGHLLGLRHPDGAQCPRPGRLAPVMAQQSTELDGCLPNLWPLPAEVALLARHELPLAPPPG